MELPGISAAACDSARLRHVTREEATELCGQPASGLWIPYFRLDGSDVMDRNRPYGRLRLDVELGGKKYHQEAGTTVHAYITQSARAMPPGGETVVVEGEKKALALSDAGVPAVGISGFFGFETRAHIDEVEIVTEFAEVIDKLHPAKILFLGDNDTCLNAQFSMAATRLAKLLPGITIALPRIPINEPKGIDDCRAAKNGGFGDFWRRIAATSIGVKPSTKPDRLAIQLFGLESDRLPQHHDRDWLEDRLVKFAAAFADNPLLQDKVVSVACQVGIGRVLFRQAVSAEIKHGSSDDVPTNLEAYYYPATGKYFILDSREKYIDCDSKSVMIHLASHGFSRDTKNCRVSAAEVRLISIQRDSNVAYAGPLAGYRAGLVEMCGETVLVTKSPSYPVPEPGEWPTIRAFLDGLMADPEHDDIDQLPHLMGWVKLAYESLANHEPRQAQAVAFCGPRGAGKSLLQDLIAECLGGRKAKPYRYMSGATEFNADLFAAENLMIEDEVPSTDISSRRFFGCRIKDFTVNSVHSCHSKGRNAVHLTPAWRLTISVNDEPENLLILPPIDESLTDKLMIFRVHKTPLPMPTTTAEERSHFRGTLSREIPAFLHYLVNWTIPDGLVCPRFGVKHFHHPDILESLTDMAPETRLLELIDLLMDSRDDAGPFHGASAELERQLMSNEATARDAQKLLSWQNAMGTYLGRLSARHPDRINATMEGKSRKRVWNIKPRHWVYNSENEDQI